MNGVLPTAPVTPLPEVTKATTTTGGLGMDPITAGIMVGGTLISGLLQAQRQGEIAKAQGTSQAIAQQGQSQMAANQALGAQQSGTYQRLLEQLQQSMQIPRIGG